MTISLCLMVRNEKPKLAACLQSATDLVDEAVVVDTGSVRAQLRHTARQVTGWLTRRHTE
jgi:hypothetical protein